MSELQTQAKILVVDDDRASLDLLVDTLATQHYEVWPTSNAEQALKVAREHAFDLYMIDVMMPGVSGYELCAMFKADEALRDVPIIFVSAVGDMQVKVIGFKVGGVDYVTKPYHRDELLARVKTHLDLRRQAFEIARLKEAEVEQLRRVTQLKDEVLRMVAHDIKNPLSIIVGYIQLIQINNEDYLAKTPQTAEHFKIMRRNVDKILGMVRDLLDLARMESRIEAHTRFISVNILMQRAVEDQTLAAHEKRIQLTAHPLAEDVMILVDPDRISQVLENLIGNAIKYTPDSGQVELLAEVRPGEVVLMVRDNGLGIPAEDIPHLFDKFYRVNSPEHRKRSGSGLGLAIVKTLVEMHGGKVWAESALGQGSTFFVSLPCQDR